MKINQQTPGEQPSLEESWQLDNFRALDEQRLFQDLHKLKIDLSPATFDEIAARFDSPEQMTETLATHLQKTPHDHAYLILFELWRRHIPEKQTLSLACDELDHLIMLYDSKQLSEPTEIEDQIDLIKEILEENVDLGMDPKKAFQLIESHSANGIEDFLYDYILDQIKGDQLQYASDLIQDFYPYLKEPRWFDFLKARLLYISETEEGVLAIEKLILEEEHPNVELNLEILSFLAKRSIHELFFEIATKTLPLLQVEGDLTDFARALLLLYAKNGLSKEKHAIQAILDARSKIQEETALNPTDPILEKLPQLLSILQKAFAFQECEHND